MPPLVHTIILTWDGSHATATCLDGLARQTYPNHRTILVDNGGTSAQPAITTPQITQLRLDQNRGFAGGVNAGIRAALADGADYIWLLNDDAEAPPDTLAKLIAAAEADPGIGIASPIILNSDAAGAPAFCGGQFDPATRSFRFTDQIDTYRAWERAAPDRIWVVGTAMLLRRALIERIGLFDEDLFAYWEDNDICLRAIAAGFRCAMVPEAAVLHPNGDPTAGETARPPYYHYYMARNHLLLLRKHGGLRANARPLFWALLDLRREAARAPAAAVRDAIRRGVWHGFRGVTGPIAPGGAGAARLGRLCLAAAGILAAVTSAHQVTPRRGAVPRPP